MTNRVELIAIIIVKLDNVSSKVHPRKSNGNLQHGEAWVGKKKVGEKHSYFKYDFEKPYNRMEWDLFLIRWCEWDLCAQL